ncbi:MAG: hypothetical protein ABJB85_10265 [Nitrososphaerota archaeon]
MTGSELLSDQEAFEFLVVNEHQKGIGICDVGVNASSNLIVVNIRIDDDFIYDVLYRWRRETWSENIDELKDTIVKTTRHFFSKDDEKKRHDLILEGVVRILEY